MVDLPAFMKKPSAPQSNPLAQSVPEPTVAKAHELGNAIESMLTELERLKNEVNFHRQNADHLDMRLQNAERERDILREKADFYERFSMSIVTNFNTIRMIVDDTQRRANEAARNTTPPPTTPPTPEPDPHLVSDDAAKAIEAALAAHRDPTKENPQ